MKVFLLLLVGCWTGTPPEPRPPVTPVHWKAHNLCNQASTELWQKIDQPLSLDMCGPFDPDYWWCAYNELLLKFDDLYVTAYRTALECD